MTTEIIPIGNSRGIRIPKPILEQCSLPNTVELAVEGEMLRLTRWRAPRTGWADTFCKAGEPGCDELLLSGVSPKVFDADEWEWQERGR